MNLRELRTGEPIDVGVEAAQGNGLSEFRPFDLLDVRQMGEGLVVLTGEQQRAVVRAVGSDARHLEVLPRPECRLAALTVTDGQSGILRLWSFGRGLVLPRSAVEIQVNAAVHDRVQSAHGLPASEQPAWLKETFCLPGGSSGSDRIIARVDPGETALGRSFTVVGPKEELDVQLVEGGLRTIRLAPPRESINLATTLIETSVQFSLEPPRGDGGATLGALLSEGGYLRRWSHYNDLEQEQVEQRASEVGEADFDSAEALPTGAWRFTVLGGSRFLAEARSGMPVEARDDVPTDGRPYGSTFIGEVEAVHAGAGAIDVKPLKGSETPPREGSLRYGLGGSSVAYRRRLDAARLLATGNVPIPRLGALLEMRTAPVETERGRSGWDSPAVRQVFGSRLPTEAQKRAIEIALNTPDVAVIQGPPGTGKTRVIAAIAARIAEEGGASGGRRVLLTSHQHDAVDNVASLTRVFGLPSFKEGRGEHGGAWLRAWRQERLAHAAELFRSMDQGEVAELREWVTERRDAYVLAPSSIEAASDLLSDVAERCAPYLSALTIESLLSTSQRLRSGSSGRERDRNLLAAIRALRTTPESHSDDGAANAARLLHRLNRGSETETDLSAVEEAAETDRLTDTQCAAVRAAKDELLDRFGLTSIQTATPVRNGDVVDALAQVIDGLEERLRAEGKGIASVLSRFVHDLETDPEGVERALASYAAVVAATCQASASLAARPLAAAGMGGIDTVIVDEAARANPLDLQIPMTVADRRVILVGDQRQLPHIVDDRLASSVSESEAEARELEESLFGRLFRFLKAERESGRADRVVTLNAQFRMHPVLGEFVSASFYEPHGESIASPLGAEEFSHALPGYEGRCAAWLDVPRGAERRVGTSRVRQAEAEAIALELHRLMEAGPDLTFGVITFYRAQVTEIMEALLPLGVTSHDPETGELGVFASQWRFTTAPDGELVERLRIGTVDAFQGKEFDVVFLSMVRTPSPKTLSPKAAFGHLVVSNRLCVAMSRQKRLLICVGDRQGLLDHPAAEEYLAPVRAFGELCLAGSR